MLAAGGSQRMGQSKQLLRRKGESLLHASVRTAQATGLPLLLVLGCESERCADEVADLRPRLLVNPDWASGMGCSIACAARELQRRGAPPAVLLALVDQPALRATHYLGLVERYRRGPERICLADYGAGRRGPPALFAPELLPELAALDGDAGARAVVQRHADSVASLPMPEAAFDLDTPRDRRRWEQEQ